MLYGNFPCRKSRIFVQYLFGTEIRDSRKANIQFDILSDLRPSAYYVLPRLLRGSHEYKRLRCAPLRYTPVQLHRSCTWAPTRGAPTVCDGQRGLLTSLRCSLCFRFGWDVSLHHRPSFGDAACAGCRPGCCAVLIECAA